MSNRCGRRIESKGEVRGNGQNYININFNFNGKDKPNTFQGKKIDNFIEINNDPKSHPSRPNVSMETLKQKKKKSNAREQLTVNPDLPRKKSKSRLNEAFTPQKKMQERGNGDSRSITKKSTTKRNSRSTQNLRYFHRKRTPQQSRSKSRSNSNSKFHSKSKSRSKSKSSKKLIKNPSSSKVGLVRPKTASNSTTGLKASEQKPTTHKTKRSTGKKIESEHPSGPSTHSNAFKKKGSPEKGSRKKLSHDESKKNIKSSITKNRKKSKQKERKELQRHPLVHEQEPDFDQQSSYKKINNEAHRLIYEDAIMSEKKKTEKKELVRVLQQSERKKSKKVSLAEKYINGTISHSELEKLEEATKIIQKYGRGFLARKWLNSQLNLAHFQIQNNKKKIADLDPKLWDDGRSNSIIQAEDIESSLVQEDPGLHSDIERPMSESIASSKEKMATNRVIEYQCSQDILDKLNKLEEEMKEQRNKYSKLQEQNKDLKLSLQKVSAQQSFQSGGGGEMVSGLQSMESSIKSNMSGWEEIKIRPGEYSESQIENNSSQNFQLRLPKKIESRGGKKQKAPKEKKQISLQENHSIESSNNSNAFEKYKGKVESLECSSPKFNPGISIDSALVELFKKKEEHLKNNFEEKSNKFERLLKDSIFSPRTYNFKKGELELAFKRETDVIRNKLEEATQAINYAKEIDEMPRISSEQRKQPEVKEEIKKQAQKIIHVVEDYGNVDLNSHRSKEEKEEFSLENFNKERKSEQKSQGEGKKQEQIKASIEATNNQAIVIFNEIEQYNKSSDEEDEKGVEDSEGQGEGEERGEQNQMLQNRGFETTLLFIKEYCVTFFEFLRASGEHKSTFISGLCEPIEYDMIEFLKSYRTTVQNDNQSSYNSQLKDYLYPYFKFLFPKTQVLTREAFLQFNSTYEKLLTECQYPVERDYFVNSLLDAFNESFDYERPCSYYGLPPPWIAEPKALKNHPLYQESEEEAERFSESQRFEQACGSAIARVIQWSTSLCGFIPESPDIGDVQIDQQQINHIRETRMALMLEKDLLENQQQMLDSVVEQSEVKLHLSKVIMEELIEQLVRQGNFFK